MRLKLRGINPGADYEVRVSVRVRVCGAGERVAFRVTENSSPPGRNRPIVASNRRKGVLGHSGRCQTHRLRWTLQDRFFGVSRYRVGVRARTSNRRFSAVASRHVDTYD